MRRTSFIIITMITLARKNCWKCCAFASRSIFTVSRNTPTSEFQKTLRGGATSATESPEGYIANGGLSNSENYFSGIANKSKVKDFGGLSFQDNSGEFRVIFVLGGPGAGKGTQSDLMLKEYPCAHLSVGQLLRDETANIASPHATLIEECLVAGRIVPVEISLDLLRSAMKGAQGDSLLFLVDGFPRNFDNLHGWAIHMHNDANVLGVLVYQCPLPVLEKRILERGKESGRSDDNLESLRKRFKTFESDTLPIIETLRRLEQQSSLKVWDIQGDKPLDKVWDETRRCMNAFIANDVIMSNYKLLEAVERGMADVYTRLCADEMVGGKSPEDNMEVHEGSGVFKNVPAQVKDAKLDFISGKHVKLAYKRSSKSSIFHETRIWVYTDGLGWRNVHYSRKPCS